MSKKISVFVTHSQSQQFTELAALLKPGRSAAPYSWMFIHLRRTDWFHHHFNGSGIFVYVDGPPAQLRTLRLNSTIHPAFIRTTTCGMEQAPACRAEWSLIYDALNRCAFFLFYPYRLKSTEEIHTHLEWTDLRNISVERCRKVRPEKGQMRGEMKDNKGG